jgi:diguanylate cyclase (GGDEF)-like protein/PAS domain S-box-containing protein
MISAISHSTSLDQAKLLQLFIVFVLFISVLVIEFSMVAGLLDVRAGLILLTLMTIAAVFCGLWSRYHRTAFLETKDEHQTAVASLADFATDMFWETDTHGFVIGAGGRLMEGLVSHPRELIGQHYLSIVHLEDREMKRMQAALNAQEPYSDIQSIFRDRDDRIFYISLSATPTFDKDGIITGYLGVGTNMTERVISARKLKHMAEHDMLTGLANRYRFSDQIKDDLRTADTKGCLSLLALDLDGFKAINDELGHQAGDALLNLVGKRLRSLVRSNDWAARMGGDEFVVVSRGVKNPMEACLLAARLLAKLSQPYRIGGALVEVTASIGIACAPIHASDADDLMKCADLAMYQAKADGRNCYRLFEPSTKTDTLSP